MPNEAKTLVAYFSATGTTERLAKRIAQATGADIFEIEPLHPYTRADLNWNDKRSRSSLEAADPSLRPAIAGGCDGISRYDVVFVGFPIWWYVAPSLVNTFLESYDLAGKVVVPFATSGGSGMGRTAQALAASAPGASIKAGAVLNGASDARIAEFVETHR